jgi:predicted ATPase
MHLSSVSFHPDKYPCRDRYPFGLRAFWETPELVFDTPVTLFVGENGTGKSTLLEAIGRQCGIHIWRENERRRLETNPYEDRFGDYLSVEWVDGPVPGSFFSSSVFQDFVRILDEWAAADPGQLKYFGGRSLVTQSHGQSILSFFRSRYQIKGLYLMDEPETALSPRSQLALLELLAGIAAAGQAQCIMATHSPILLACPGARIYSFDHSPIQPVAYEETEHFRLYRDFLADPQRYVARFNPNLSCN